MSTRLWPSPFLAALLAFLEPGVASAASPGDGNAASGRKLVEKNCQSCHDHGVYTRKDRRINDLGALKTQIQSCNHQLPTKLGDAERNDITAYLNEQYYRFK